MTEAQIKTGLIETERLTLREFCSTDVATILGYANNNSINRNLSFGSIATQSGVTEYIETAISNSQQVDRVNYKLAMLIKPNSDIAGSCWLDITDPRSRNTSIGYFVDQREWGKGYASEMVHVLIQFGFTDLKLHRIYCNCNAENIAIRKVLEKNRFKQEGLLRQHLLRSLGWTDVCYYGILETDFTDPS